MFIPHQWNTDDDGALCIRCGITGEQYDFIHNRASTPTCTFSFLTEWYDAQPDIIPQDVIDEAKRLLRTETVCGGCDGYGYYISATAGTTDCLACNGTGKA